MDATADVSDEQLMQRYRRGDALAFEQLYQRHRGPVYRYIARLCGQAADAEALFQDTWLKVISARQQWRDDEPFLPWLYRIAHNRVIDAWRRERGGFDALVDDETVDAAAPDVARLHRLRDCVERLLALLSALPEVQRSAFLLQQEGGLTLEQIGSITGVERETVKSRLRYATNRLRKGLEDCDE